MATALVALATTTLASNATTITFSSIASGYRDLRLVILAGTDANTGFGIRVNGDSSASYAYVGMRGNGSGTASPSSTTATYMNIGNETYSNSIQLLYTVDFLDAFATDKHKTVLSRGGNAATATEAHANRWPSTSAITSITVFPLSGNATTGSTFSLYGIVS